MSGVAVFVIGIFVIRICFVLRVSDLNDRRTILRPLPGGFLRPSALREEYSFLEVDEERDTIGDLRNLTIYSSTGGTAVPGTQVAGGVSTWELSRISHRNQMRTLTVELKHEELKAPEL